jgi:MFS family permease
MSRSGVLLVIVLAQFFCTSVWFAGNTVVQELLTESHLKAAAIAQITSAVQLGFICGTLGYAILTIVDRFSPVKVFFISSLLTAAFNIGAVFIGGHYFALLILRFFTGFFLAGIYPVGMKIAADHFDNKLGKALGFLVGALVVGTALPHLIRALSFKMTAPAVFQVTTALAITGGSMVRLLVRDGPHRKKSQGFDTTVVVRVFRQKEFRAAAFGYFGHMWELYAFWAFVPVMISSYLQHNGTTGSSEVSLLSFLIIGCGGLACVGSGLLSQVYGSRKTAKAALICSGLCCLVSPLSFYLPQGWFIGYLLFWGLVVIADSPMFSTMVALNAPTESKGTALTIVNCIGFSITIISIGLLSMLAGTIETQYLLLVLTVGPMFGLYHMRRLRRDA